jgi:predicted nucleic acid-binding protein
MASRPKIFLDTWAWLALADRSDPWHGSARQAFHEFRSSLQATTDYVLDETITKLFLRLPFGQAQEFCRQIWMSRDSGRLVVYPITELIFERAWELRLRYRDKPRISFTDLTSFVVIEEMAIPYVLTGDVHFAQAGLPAKVLPAQEP